MSLVLENANIFDGHSDEIAADRHIVIENGRIVDIEMLLPKFDAERRIDLASEFVIPGLIDAHFHAYAADPSIPFLESPPTSYVILSAQKALESALKSGFTSVRDAAGADYGFWRALEDDVISGPRLLYAGKALSQTGGHGDSRAQSVEPCGCAFTGHLSLVVDGVDAMRAAVRETLRCGAHQVKLMLSGGISSPTDPIWMLQYSDEEIRAAVEEAARRKSYVMGHAYTPETIRRAVKCGVRSIEHANLIDEHAAKVVADANAYVVPTLVTYDAIGKYGKALGVPKVTLDKLEEVKEQGLQAVEICREAGVSLGLGTDLLGNMRAHQMEEFAIRAEIDAPLDVLRSATSVNAELLQESDNLGAVKIGHCADFLVLRGNPLDDLSTLYGEAAGPHLVIKAGEIEVDRR
ncbi:MAG: amidohydrolase family protein [Candidatus Azotimanducaceae bacterium WSBS_2022_MAG_OTU7]